MGTGPIDIAIEKCLWRAFSFVPVSQACFHWLEIFDFTSITAAMPSGRSESTMTLQREAWQEGVFHHHVQLP